MKETGKHSHMGPAAQEGDTHPESASVGSQFLRPQHLRKELPVHTQIALPKQGHKRPYCIHLGHKWPPGGSPESVTPDLGRHLSFLPPRNC